MNYEFETERLKTLSILRSAWIKASDSAAADLEQHPNRWSLGLIIHN
jgi:hypothetical protein